MLATLVVVLIAAIGGWFVLKAQHDARKEQARELVGAQNRLRSLALFMVARATERGWKSFPYDGKAFVLAPVAFRDLEPRRRRQLTALWSPSRDEARRDLDLAEYEKITRAMLRDGGDFSHLTSHAGRMNADASCAITPNMARDGVPILADAQVPEKVIIAFSTGEVRAYSYEELGLPEDGPVVFGPDSPAELLRCLSDK